MYGQSKVEAAIDSLANERYYVFLVFGQSNEEQQPIRDFGLSKPGTSCVAGGNGNCSQHKVLESRPADNSKEALY